MADLTMPNPPQIAVDTNVLIDWADNNALVLDCFTTIRRKYPNAPIIVPPTVIEELTDIASDGDSDEEKQLALTALKKMRPDWGLKPFNFVPVGHGIVEETAWKIRAAGIIPEEEIHDSLIIAESALLNVTLLLTSDGHITDVNQCELGKVLDGCDVGKPIIFSPAKIVRDFFNLIN
jgi:predicted nucleic acid-binding protein